MNSSPNIKTSQKESFKKALSYYLAIAGKHQSDLCKDLNLSSSTVSEWYTGKRIPRPERIQLLAEYLNAPVDQFLIFKDPATKNIIDNLSSSLKENDTLLELVGILSNLENEDLYFLKTLTLKLLK